MHTQYGFAVALGLALASAGCAGVDRPLQQRVAAEAMGLQPAVDDDQAVVRTATDVADARAPAASDTPLAPDAGLEDYVRIALRDNPSIRRAIREAQALGYRVPQVTSLDDPMFEFAPPTGDMTQTAAGMMDAAVGVAQKIPFPGKLAARGRIAEQSVRMALDSLAEARITTLARVQQAYYGYYLADVSIQITRESQDLLSQIRDVALARYRAGAATQPDVLRAEVQLYNLANELITLGQQRVTVQARLNTLMNRRVDASLPAPRAFELSQVEWRLPEAMARAVASNPRLARVREQVLRDLEAVKLARLEYFPDVNAGLLYTFIGMGISPVATGSDSWDLSVGLNLPIWWQRLRAAVLEANARALASTERYAEVRNALFFELQDTLVEIDTQYRQAVLYRDGILPRAWQAVEVSTSAYRAGALEFTALFDSWRTWLDFSLGYHRALATLEQRFADLQQLIGVRVPRTAPPAIDAGEPPGAGEPPAGHRSAP